MITLAAFALAAGCVSLQPGSDSIRAADLAGAYPDMAALPAQTVIAPAPLPGFARTFHSAELRRIAATHALPNVPERDVCVQRAMAPLDPERMLAAMQAEWPEARLEILESNRQPAPEGTIHFPKTGLHVGPDALSRGALWTGWVQYSEKGRFSTWARVKIGVAGARVVAVRDLAPGGAIAAGDVELAKRDTVPDVTSPFAVTLDQVIGKTPRRTIRGGELVRLDQIAEAKVVLPGDNVKVTVRNGKTLLQLDGVAEGSGAAGETVSVRNPESQRRFRARVEAKGRVAVDVGGVKQ
jgi:flagella basal body P-ring formation protein FlgA